MDKLNKKIYLIAAGSFVLLLLAVYFLFIFQKSPGDIKQEEVIGEVKKLEETPLAKRPFVTLTPTSDGAEIIISIENMQEFERAEYELTYLADNPTSAGEKIERGTTGTDVNTKEQKYKKSLLLGTASRGVRNPDTGITDGKLTLHLYIGDTEFQSESKWIRLEAGQVASTLKDASGKLNIKLPALGKDYWIILADTIGIPPSPKEFSSEDVILPIYGSFAVAPQFSKKADLTITLDGDLQDAKIHQYNLSDSSWKSLSLSLIHI